MSTRPRRMARASSVVALGVALSIALLQGLGTAAVPKPTDRVTQTVEDSTPLGDSQTEAATSGQTSTDSSTTTATTDSSTDGTESAAKSTSPGDDSDGHETPVPGAPDHASGSIAEVALAGQDLVQVGHTNAQVNDDGTSQGDVTVLAIGGQEVLGAHSESEGEETATAEPIPGLCESAGVCLLFAETNSSNKPESAHSDATTTLATACIGNTSEDPVADCNAPVKAGVSTSSSSIDRDKTTGGETATQETDLADVCVGGENETGTCNGIGADAIHSESTSSVDGNKQAQTESSSYLADVQVGGQDIVLISDPTAITLPPGCPQGASLLCVFFNQSAETVSTGVAGSRQEALHVDVLAGAVGGSDLALAHAGIAESFVRWSTPTCCAPPPPGEEGGGPGLAFTGFGLTVPLAVLVFLLGAGLILSREARRRTALA